MFQEAKIEDNKSNLKSNDKDDIFGDIYVLRPSTTDILIIGTNFTIKWSYKGSIEFVTIALYKDYKFIDTITITTSNDGEYLWHIDNYEESNDYSIGIWDYNDFNNYDFSDSFLITMHPPTNLENYLLIITIGILIGITILTISLILGKLMKNR
ncbi:MAG: Ser-Thr-rich GPI-anchored membrane family protein [Promethearchaeota archaeon]